MLAEGLFQACCVDGECVVHAHGLSELSDRVATLYCISQVRLVYPYKERLPVPSQHSLCSPSLGWLANLRSADLV